MLTLSCSSRSISLNETLLTIEQAWIILDDVVGCTALSKIHFLAASLFCHLLLRRLLASLRFGLLERLFGLFFAMTDDLLLV